MAEGNALQNAVNWLKSQGYLPADITNKEIATQMGYSEVTFSKIWKGSAPTARFIKDFQDAHLKKHDVKWDDFDLGPPVGKISQNELQKLALANAGANKVLLDEVKALHDKVDVLTKLVQKLLNQ